MADKGDAQGGGEEGKDDEEPKKGCCEKYADCLLVTWQCTYNVVLAIIQAIRACLAFFWYPCKERCCRCIDSCDRSLNPWKDDGYRVV